jgi:hypothetical protein
MVEQHTKLTADHPAPVRFAFLADLARTAPLSARVDQFDPEGVNQPDQRRSSHKPVDPMTMRVE